jgi:hypothetical protein
MDSGHAGYVPFYHKQYNNHASCVPFPHRKYGRVGFPSVPPLSAVWTGFIHLHRQQCRSVLVYLSLSIACSVDVQFVSIYNTQY